jgi:hypothetical protein
LLDQIRQNLMAECLELRAVSEEIGFAHCQGRDDMGRQQIGVALEGLVRFGKRPAVDVSQR